ncbi:MAG: type II secretion system F family protein [Planctomycetaceae bacterium]|nr:type II secretion system F family protein [Planctomycetaceae bacterium]
MATGFSQHVEIESRPEYADILKSKDQYANPELGGVSNDINNWFDRLMVQSGVSFVPLAAILMCVLGAMTLGGFVWILQENPFSAGLATFVGLVLPIGGLMVARSRRQTLIMDQLPPMIDELARAARTGRSLDQCLEMIAADTPSPLGDEMQECLQKLQMGVTLNEALYQLPEKTGVNGLRILATALSVHQQTGGDLVRVLDRLSRTLRDRSLFLGRLRTATAGSRATAILFLLLPPAILVFFNVRDPEYFNRLMASDWGRFVTISGVVLEIVGAIWVMAILNNSQKT